MNFNLEISGMPENIGTYISLGFLALLFVFTSVGFLYGLKRGLAKSTLRLITVIVSVVAAFIFAKWVGNLVIAELGDKTLKEIVTGFYSDYESLPEKARIVIEHVEKETTQYIAAIPLFLVVTPLVFVLSFFVFKLLTLIVFWIVAAIIGIFGKRKTTATMFGGAAVGAVQGLLIAIVIMVPFIGYVGLADDMKEPLTSERVPVEVSDNVGAVYDTVLDDVIDSTALKLVGNIGGNALFNGLTTVEIEGDWYTMSEQTAEFGYVIADLMSFNDFDWTNPETRKESIDMLIKDVGDNKYLSTVISGVFRIASTSMHDGLIPLPEDEPYRTATIDILLVFETSSADTLKGDLTTLKNIYYILGEGDALIEIAEGDGDALTDKLVARDAEGKIVIHHITEELGKNPRTKPVVASVAKISVALMCNQFHVDQDIGVLYEDVKENINNVLTTDRTALTKEEYIAEVSDELDTVLREHDIALKKEIVDGMAEYVHDNLKDKEEITDEEVNEVILSYYESYAKYLESGDPDDLPADSSIPSAEDLPAAE